VLSKVGDPLLHRADGHTEFLGFGRVLWLGRAAGRVLGAGLAVAGEFGVP
jgi:hypothetical protein